MKEQITVQAVPRSAKGSCASRRIRREGWMPGVIYGEGKPARELQLQEKAFHRMLSRHSGEHMVLDLNIEGEGMRKVLLKHVQRNPLSSGLLHADFHEISMTRKLRVDVPVVLRGDPIGVTQGGGLLDHLLRVIEVECLPADLLEEIAVDVVGLALGQHLCVRDIHLDASKYAILTSPELAIAAVSLPKVEEEAAPEPVEGTEGAAAAATPGEPGAAAADKDKKAESAKAAS